MFGYFQHYSYETVRKFRPYASNFSSFHVNLEASSKAYSESCKTLKIDFFTKILLGKGYYEHCQISMMKFFPKIVNG